MPDLDPHDQIERLESRIEDLTARLENCRKFILASRIAIVAGGGVLAALLFGAIRFDPTWMAAGAAALLGGIVGYGSNSSTANETSTEIAAVEAERAKLIDEIELRLVSERPTLH